MHEFQSLGTEVGCEKADPRGIAARPIEARHEPVLDRVAAGPEDNWNNGGHRLGRLSRGRAEREHYCPGMTPPDRLPSLAGAPNPPEPPRTPFLLFLPP